MVNFGTNAWKKKSNYNWYLRFYEHINLKKNIYYTYKENADNIRAHCGQITDIFLKQNKQKTQTKFNLSSDELRCDNVLLYFCCHFDRDSMCDFKNTSKNKINLKSIWWNSRNSNIHQFLSHKLSSSSQHSYQTSNKTVQWIAFAPINSTNLNSTLS